MKEVHIIGGGIVGICAAWYLSAAGRKVTVLDKSNMLDGTSHGNAGMIVPSHFVPMATPGVITQGLKWLLDNKSPFYVKPRLDLDLLNWLWKFYRSANAKKVKESMPVLLEINQRSKALYQEIASAADFDFGYDQKGLLMLYKTAKQEQEEHHLAEQAHQLGVEAEMLSPSELKKLEPHMDLDVRGGIYFPGDAHLYPNLLMQKMKADLVKRGVTFLSGHEVLDLNIVGTKIDSVQTNNHGTIPVDELLVTSGSWTALLLRKIGIKLLIQDGKGYSITLKEPSLRPSIPTILAEAKVAITPMGADLRIGGTLELSGLSPNITKSRVAGIIESIPKYYRNMPMKLTGSSNLWQGYRPCTPDGMPYIGRSERFSNLTLGTGHGMMGLSLGAVTGLLLSQLINKEEPTLELDPFRLDRF